MSRHPLAAPDVLLNLLAFSTPAGSDSGAEQGLKPQLILLTFSARLKSCPFKAKAFQKLRHGPKPCPSKLIRGRGDLFTAAFDALDQLHVETERLQFANQDVERLRHAGFNGGFAFHDGLIDLGAAKHVVGLRGEQLLQDVSRAIRFQRPDFHFAEALSTELRFTAQRLLGDERVRSDRAGVDLVVDQVRKLEHVDVADGYRLLELVTCHAVKQVGLARFRQPGFTQHRLDFMLAPTVKHRRRKIDALGHGLRHAHQLVFAQIGDLRSVRRVLEDALELSANYFLARILFEELSDAIAKFMPGPAQVRFQDLSYVHTAGNAERVEHDLDRCPVREVRHIFVRQNAGNHAFVAVTASHLVADAEFALHGDVYLHQLDHAGRQFITLLQFADLLVGDLAQNVNLARGHFFDFVNLLVHGGIFVRVLNALQVAGGNPLNGLAVEYQTLGEQALVGALVMQVSLDFLIAQYGLKTLQPLVGKDSDFIRQVLFQTLDLRGLNGLGAFVFLLSFAGEDFDVHHRAFNSRRAGERCVAHVAGFFAEDGAQQLLFRRELGLALGRDFADHHVALFYRRTNADHTPFVQIAQR